jgi:hypothetical protein
MRRVDEVRPDVVHHPLQSETPVDLRNHRGVQTEWLACLEIRHEFVGADDTSTIFGVNLVVSSNRLTPNEARR